MTDKDKQIVDLKLLVLGLGDAAVNLIEQEMKCNFRSDDGHLLRMNKSFQDLAVAVQKATKYAEEQGG